MPIILIGIAGTIFFTFTKPLYTDIAVLRGEVAAYNEALNNSKALESERDKLVKKYDAIGGENIGKLQKFLPESIDNIRLILEIEKIAKPYLMTLRDVKYDTVTAKQEAVVVTPGAIVGGTIAESSKKDYGIWDLQFSVESNYSDFINFMKDIENNLRIVDIDSISFSSNTGVNANSGLYNYTFRIKTYWLKK